MLRYILFDTTLFDQHDDKDVHEARKDLMWILEALTQRNQNYLKQHPNTPRLYESGVKYEVPKQFEGECEEVSILRRALGSSARKRGVADVLDTIQMVLGGERFRDIGRIIENGAGDCDNLACWRVAELRQAGIKARPYMTNRQRPDGGITYHALVLWPPFGSVNYETTEDPSLLLGMGGESRFLERDEEIRKNAERSEILRERGPGTAGNDDLDSMMEEMLGGRQRQAGANDAFTEIDDLIRRMG